MHTNPEQQMQVTNQLKINAAAASILRAARHNPNITSASLTQEIQDGAVEGWLHIPAVAACNFSQWTGAMAQAAGELAALENRKAAAAARRAEIFNIER